MSTTETAIETLADDLSTTNATEIADVARRVFGWDPLRAGIEHAVSGVLGGRDVLAVMPTGYGKSSVYQLAGALRPGLVIVVSPLIALQADQVASLRDRPEARPAALINSTIGERAIEEAWAGVDDGTLGYLFVAPERFADDAVIERLAAAHPSLLVVDEAHCVSSWGHDFRPDYLRLGEVAERLGRPPILALTATGSRPVREEVLERLGMPDALVLTHGFDRPNIHLSVRRHEQQADKVAAVLADVEELAKPGLLYVATRKETETFAEQLRERGIAAEPYHGSLPAKRRRELSAAFHEGELDVVVATSAFGMGIDKPDVRFVVHAAVTESLDEYYQEVGRAGRDGSPSAAKLHYREEDLGLRRFFGATAPSRGDVRRFVAAVTEHPDLKDAAESLGISARRATSLANLLVDAGVAELADRRLVATETDGEKAVDAAIGAAEDRERIDASRLAMMRQYAETRSCRRQFVLGYFGDATAGPCGTCDTCESGSAIRIADLQDVQAGEQVPFPVDATVEHSQWGMGRVMRVEEDRITVFFDSEGYRTLALAAVLEHDLLVRTGSPDPVGSVDRMSDSTNGPVDYEANDPEALAAEADTLVTNDAVAGETVLPGAGDGNDGPTGGAPGEITPDEPANELQADGIDLDDEDEGAS
jgi:ATP-dependent DNA helicase RecQ